MKILVICQHYWPENFRVTEICEELVKRGHSVTALVGRPNYPDGVIPERYKHFRNRHETHNGVEIIRCQEIGRKPGKVGLAVNYLSYMIPACFKALTLKKDYDVVYAFSTSPVLMSLPAALLRCFTSRKLMIYILDIWPACLAALNIQPTSLLYRFMTPVSKWVYSKADSLIYSSGRFREYLHDVHSIEVPEEHYMPQFAEDLFRKVEMADKNTKDHYDFVFAGNIGKVQAVDVLIKTAGLLREKPIVWHIVGDGSEAEQCKILAEELEVQEKVIFYGQKPLKDMPGFYSMADALLVSMKSDVHVNDTLPGKVQSYMAAGKPILASIDGEAKRVIETAGCGFCASPNDPVAFAECVCRFMSSEDKELMGKNGQAYYDQYFDKEKHMDKLERMLLELGGRT